MVDESRPGLEAVKRPLSAEETELLKWLLENGFNGAERFLPQIDRLTVFEKCTCGCPTVYFALDDEPVARKGEKLISDHFGEVDGSPVGAMVFQTDGRISSLEVYSLPGTDKPFGLPAISSLIKGL